jgi:hypothetical protein
VMDASRAVVPLGSAMVGVVRLCAVSML